MTKFDRTLNITLLQIDCLQMVVLKHKFKLRFFIDESVSFGTLGDHGKGITEYAGLELNDIDLIMATLEYSAGSIGGFCVGTTYVVEHQGCFVLSIKSI